MSRRPLVAGRDPLKDALAVTIPDNHEQNMNRNEKTSTHTNSQNTIKKKSMKNKSMRGRRSRRWQIIRVRRKRNMHNIKTVSIMKNKSKLSRA